MKLFGKTKPAEKKSQAQAFAEFKEAIREAVSQAKRHAVWDVTLGDFLSRYGDALGGGR
jgi:hypothetical protein